MIDATKFPTRFDFITTGILWYVPLPLQFSRQINAKQPPTMALFIWADGSIAKCLEA
jgi:hypothetical protein